MLNDVDLLAALTRHWQNAGVDEDASHEIYHHDAVLEFPQSGERFEGVHNFREWRRQYPAVLRFHTRRITHRDDLVVVENLISYDGAPWAFSVTSSSSGTTAWPTSGSTSWTAGNRRSGVRPGAPTRLPTPLFRSPETRIARNRPSS